MTRVTMRDVAATAGVTKMSVSNAFSRPDRISVELRKRILDVASELGYHGPDARARALARGRTGLVGVLLSGSAADAFVDATAVMFIGGVVAALSERSLSVGLIAPPAASTPLPARDLAMDGALVYASDPDDPGYRALVERALPVVTIDQLDGLAGHGVVVDDRGGAAAATRHLVDLGHERIAILAPRPTPNFRGHVTERIAGWRQDLPVGSAEPLLVDGLATRAEAHAAAAPLLISTPSPTAVLCFSDTIAAGVADAAAELGLEVPGDLSIVGFDDGPLAQALDLTTVRQDLSAKSTAAVSMLFELMDADEPPAARVEHLPVELVLRGSTAAPGR